MTPKRRYRRIRISPDNDGGRVTLLEETGKSCQTGNEREGDDSVEFTLLVGLTLHRQPLSTVLFTPTSSNKLLHLGIPF